MIPPGYRHNFETLQRAIDDGNVALVECTDKVTGKNVYAICAIQPAPDSKVDIIPFAKMFDGNPYDELDPPVPPSKVQ